MSIDKAQVQWDAPDPKAIQWDGDKPKARERLPVERLFQNLAAGGLRGAGSIGATLLTPVDAAARALGIENSVIGRTDRRQAMDAALSGLGAETDSAAFGAGKLGAEIAGTAGVGGALANSLRAVPMLSRAAPVLDAVRTSGFSAGGLTGAQGLAARTLGGAVTGGASAGLVSPGDAGAGAAVGAAMPGLLSVAGRAGTAAGRALAPNIENPALADAAINKFGIPLGLADISGSNTTKAIRSVLNDAPLTGGVGSRQRDAVQEGFNRAVGGTFGEAAPSLTPEVLDGAKKRMGAEFDRIWDRNTLQFDGKLFGQLQELRQSAAKLPQGEAGRLTSWLDDLETKMVPGPNGELSLPGDVANRFQSKLREQASKATGFLADDLQNLRRGILDAFKRSVSAEDAAALSKNMGQYKAFKTVEKLLQGAEAGVAGRTVGDIPAAMLPQAVRQSYGSNIASSPFAELSQIGSQYVADRVARTGGSTRAAVQNTAIGAALMGAGTVNPALAAGAIPAGLLGQKALGSPVLARKALEAANKKGRGLFQISAEELSRLGLLSAPILATDQ
jgi:hypothetical protein